MKIFGLVFLSVVESLLAHVGFFSKSFGLVFLSVVELKTRWLIISDLFEIS